MPITPAKPAVDGLIEIYRSRIEGRTILLFDGVCVFCNRTVQFLLRRDRNAALLFVPLESPLGRQLLSRFNAHHRPEGIVLIADALTPTERLSHRTDAFLDALTLLSSPWSAAARAMRFIPGALRELIYGLIARHRYRIFGRYATCPLPSTEQRARILGISS